MCIRDRGNTVRAVAKKAPCPVLIVNRPCTTCWHLFSNIVFCTDFSEAANHAFRFALNTARQLNAKLYITHAVDITSIQGMTMDQSEIERHAEQMREKIDKLYLSKLDGFANAEVIAVSYTHLTAGTAFFPPAGHAGHPVANGDGPACPARRDSDRVGRGNQLYSV